MIDVVQQAVDAAPNQAHEVTLPTPRPAATAPRIVALAAAAQTAAVPDRVLESAVGPALAGRVQKVVSWAAQHKPYIGSKPSFRRKAASSIWLRVAGVFS